MLFFSIPSNFPSLSPTHNYFIRVHPKKFRKKFSASDRITEITEKSYTNKMIKVSKRGAIILRH